MAGPFFPASVDYTSPRYWTGVVEELQPPTNHIGDRYLPRRDMPGDSIEFDQLLFRSPIAPFVALATESPRLEQGAMRKRWADALYSRFKVVLDENDLRWLRNWGDAPVTTPQGAMAAAAKSRITKLTADLDMSVENRIEWLQINTLRGLIAIAPSAYSDVALSISYPVVTHTANALWTDHTNADPINDLSSWFEDLFWVPARMIMSRKVMYNLQQSTKIRNQIFAQYPAGSAVTTYTSRAQILDLFQSEFGVSVEIYDSQYTTSSFDGTTRTETLHRFLPSNELLILPDGDLGYTGEAPAAQKDYRTGKFTWIDMPGVNVKQDPWVTEFGCGWYGVPVLNRPEAMIRATVG